GAGEEASRLPERVDRSPPFTKLRPALAVVRRDLSLRGVRQRIWRFSLWCAASRILLSSGFGALALGNLHVAARRLCSETSRLLCVIFFFFRPEEPRRRVSGFGGDVRASCVRGWSSTFDESDSGFDVGAAAWGSDLG
ncbi:unnamed protein product, partial [Ixodes pacificus]